MIKGIMFLIVLSLNVMGAPLVDLKIQEYAHVARVNEAVTMGVPLPEAGNYTDASKFTLRDASNNVIPCEITSLGTWWKNPSNIRWLQLNFPFSLPASGSAVVTLHTEASSYTLPSNLSVHDSGTFFEVNTGKIRFYVKKANFNLIDQAWVDESGSQNYGNDNQIVSSHSRGVVGWAKTVYFGVVTQYLSSNDAATTVTVERQGAGVVCLKAMGKLKTAGGLGAHNFISRIYAFNNSATIRMQNVIENQDGVTTDCDTLYGLHFEIPLMLGATRHAVVSKPDSFEQADLTGTDSLYCMVSRPGYFNLLIYTMGPSMTGVIGGVKAATFNPKTLKPRDLGWVSLSDGSRGCLVSMKYFWQMVPASMEASGDGKIIAGFFPKRSGQGVPFFAGQGRSCETQWTFYNDMTAGELRSKAVQATDRLFALASPAWYTRGTLSAVPMVEKNPALYADSIQPTIQTWESKLDSGWSQVLAFDNVNHMYFDAYGFMEWGDNFHYDYTSYVDPPFPFGVLWNGNYYGLDFFAFEHFYHTGDIRFLDYAIAHARHVQDVHMCHFGPANSKTGDCRYCPPNYHIGSDGLTYSTSNPSHHKVEGLFMDYYLMGNDYALQIALEGAEWMNRFDVSLASACSEHITTYIRRWANQMNALVWAYAQTKDTRYYQTLARSWEALKNAIVRMQSDRTNCDIGQPFMVGLGMEALVKLYSILAPQYTLNSVTQPDSIAHYFKIWGDSVLTYVPSGTAAIKPNVTIGFAFLSRFYGDKYLQAAKDKGALMGYTYSNLHKDFVQQLRAIEMAMYYLAIPDSLGNLDVKINGAAPDAPIQTLSVHVCPTPFNPTAVITVKGLTTEQESGFSLKVFSPGGVQVADLTKSFDVKNSSAVFRSDRLPSGLYVVRCKAGFKAATQKMLLIR
ncbi:MAG: hypothetical protein V1913_02125 [Fibrobacterota bacterium]